MPSRDTLCIIHMWFITPRWHKPSQFPTHSRYINNLHPHRLLTIARSASALVQWLVAFLVARSAAEMGARWRRLPVRWGAVISATKLRSETNSPVTRMAVGFPPGVAVSDERTQEARAGGNRSDDGVSLLEQLAFL